MNDIMTLLPCYMGIPYCDIEKYILSQVRLPESTLSCVNNN